MAPCSAEIVDNSIYFFEENLMFPNDLSYLFDAGYADFAMTAETVFEWRGIKFDSAIRALLFASFPRDYVSRTTVMSASSPKKAKDTMLSREAVEINYDVLNDILQHKIRQNPYLIKLLKKSNDKNLVFADFNDNTLGCGFNGRGHNLLGKCLMNVREQLLKE